MLFSLYFFACFLFGIYYFREVYGVDKESMGSDPWIGKWFATGISALLITFWAWPLLLVYMYKRYKKEQAEEAERIKRDIARRAQELDRETRRTMGPGSSC